MSKFFYITDVNGVDRLINMEYVVQMLPRENDWSVGGIITLDREAAGPSGIYLDGQEARRVREILKPS